MEQNKPVRLTFLDIMRFIALFMMIQGHTIYAILNTEIRDGSSFHVWTLLRGYTAPFFMVIAGAVFTFLLLQQDKTKIKGNIRIKKGLLRVATLLFWGYLLHFQWQALVSPISQGLVDNSVSVDVLHIIGLGLLIVIGVYVLARKYIFALSTGFLALFFLVVLFTPHFTKTNIHYFPTPFFSSEKFGADFMQEEDSLAQSHPVVIEYIKLGSKAESQGLLPNDRVLKIGYFDIHAVEELPQIETKFARKEYTNFILLRDGDTLEIPYKFQLKAEIFPNALTMWVNSQPTFADKKSLFPIFPWLSYILFGAFFGDLLAWMKSNDTLFKHLELKLLGIAALLFLLVEVGEFYELKYYGVSNFWGVTEGMGSSFTLVFHRIGVVMAVGAVCAFLARFIKKLPRIMNQMSRNTLWLYVGHLILLYVVRPKFTNDRYDVGPTMFAVALMYLLMIIQTLVIEKKNELGTWKAYLVFTSNKLKEFLPRKR